MGVLWTRYPVVQAVEKSLGARGVAARTPNRHWWSGREYQGDRANPGQGTRQITPVPRYKGDPRAVKRLALGALGGGTDQGVATVYQKHRCMRRRKPLYMH